MIPMEDPGRALAGLRLLVVEDTSIVADEIHRLLARWSCHVNGPHGTVEAALAAIDADAALDGALLDVNVDGESVYPVAAALRARGVPFIFMTGNSSRFMAPEYRDRARLEKPFGANQLATTLRRVLLAEAK